jgi:hypothetical protein
MPHLLFGVFFLDLVLFLRTAIATLIPVEGLVVEGNVIPRHEWVACLRVHVDTAPRYMEEPLEITDGVCRSPPAVSIVLSTS